MSIILRILLLVFSFLTLMYVIRKLRKEQLQPLDTLFWFFFILIIFVMSVFPNAVVACTEFLGVQSPVNFVFLVIIFLLIIRLFLLNVRICKLEHKVDEYVEKMAVTDKIKGEGKE